MTVLHASRRCDVALFVSVLFVSLSPDFFFFFFARSVSVPLQRNEKRAYRRRHLERGREREHERAHRLSASEREREVGGSARATRTM